MAISRLTALAIQGNKTRVDVSGPDEKGKYAGWIYHFEENNNWHPDLTSEPIYKSAEEARSEMKKIVKKIKSMSIEEVFK